MKKFLKITAAIVLSLLIFFVGTFKYRQYKANQISIPKNATALLKVSVDELYKSLAINAISNLSYYLDSNKQTTAQINTNKFDTGLKIPASIYFYTIAEKPKTAVFTRIAINDFQEFSSFIKHTLKLNITKKSGINFAQNSFKNFSVLYNNEYAALVLSTQIDEFEPTLKDILNEKDFIKISESKYNLLKKSTDHLSFANQGNNGTINFENGEINLTSECLLSAIVPAIKPTHRPFNPESTIVFWLNADFAGADAKTYKLKNASIAQDSLSKYFKGYFDFEWINSTQQMDSIITYEYNDNFEKVEKLTLQKREVPNIIFNITSDAGNLKKYLNQQNIIKQDSGLLNKAVFPLYKVFVGGDKQHLILSTKKPLETDKHFISTDDFFSLNIDFTKLNHQINIPFFSTHLKNLNHLSAKGKVIGTGKAMMNGKLELANKNINSLYQLLKSF